MLQIQEEALLQRREAKRRLFEERRDMLWEAEREQLLTEKINAEKKWFTTSAGISALKKLEKVQQLLRPAWYFWPPLCTLRVLQMQLGYGVVPATFTHGICVCCTLPLTRR